VTESAQLLRDREQRAVKRDRSLLALRIRALPTYSNDFVSKSEVMAILAGPDSPETDPATTTAAEHQTAPKGELAGISRA